MILIAGLGNPGLKYRKTRHNAGYLALDALAKKLGISCTKKQFSGLTGEGQIGGEKVLLLKPETFMNESGRSLRQAADYFRPKQILVLYDDIDLPLGRLRIKPKGSAGTHNGMRSCIAHLGRQDFPRIRIGIGKPETGGDLVGHVIHRMPKSEFAQMEEMAGLAAQAAICLVEEGMEKAQQKYNGKA